MIFRRSLSGPGTSAAQHGQRGTAGAEQLEPSRVHPELPPRSHRDGLTPAAPDPLSGQPAGLPACPQHAPRPPRSRAPSFVPCVARRIPSGGGAGPPHSPRDAPGTPPFRLGLHPTRAKPRATAPRPAALSAGLPPYPAGGAEVGAEPCGGAGPWVPSRPAPPSPSPAGAPTWSGGMRAPRAALPYLHSRPPLRRVSRLAEPGKQWAVLARGAVSDWLATPSIRTLPLREVLGAGSVSNAW